MIKKRDYPDILKSVKLSSAQEAELQGKMIAGFNEGHRRRCLHSEGQVRQRWSSNGSGPRERMKWMGF